MATHLHKNLRHVGTIHHPESVLGRGQFFLHAVVGTADGGAQCYCPKFESLADAIAYIEADPLLTGAHLAPRKLSFKELRAL